MWEGQLRLPNETNVKERGGCGRAVAECKDTMRAAGILLCQANLRQGLAILTVIIGPEAWEHRQWKRSYLHAVKLPSHAPRRVLRSFCFFFSLPSRLRASSIKSRLEGVSYGLSGIAIPLVLCMQIADATTLRSR